MSDTKPHEWQVGDLCLQTVPPHYAVIYHVIDVEVRAGSRPTLWIKPVMSLFDSDHHDGIRTHETNTVCVKPLSIVTMGIERAKLDSFLQAEAHKHGTTVEAELEKDNVPVTLDPS